MFLDGFAFDYGLKFLSITQSTLVFGHLVHSCRYSVCQQAAMKYVQSLVRISNMFKSWSVGGLDHKHHHPQPSSSPERPAEIKTLQNGMVASLHFAVLTWSTFFSCLSCFGYPGGDRVCKLCVRTCLRAASVGTRSVGKERVLFKRRGEVLAIEENQLNVRFRARL